MDKKVFETYSQYYDLLYQDKNYLSEINYIISLIESYNPQTKQILELGCGTGIHATLLAEQGYSVQGIDISETMLQMASIRKGKISADTSNRLSFFKGDIRNYECDQKFDTIISLFHVFSYMTTNEDLSNAFSTVKKHLKPEGVLIFDCWYGPGVLNDKPIKRIKTFENESIRITRDANPIFYPEINIVDVNFDISITNKHTKELEKLNETHSMRYLFTEELREFAAKNGLEIIHSEEWLNKNKLSEQSWNATYVCKLI